MLPAGRYNSDNHSFENAFAGATLWSVTPGTLIYHECPFGAFCGSWEMLPGHNNYVMDAEAATDTIALIPNGGTCTNDTLIVEHGTETTLPTCTHSGNWEFLGWNTAWDGSGTAYTDAITTNGNITLYAQWKTWCTGTARSNEAGTSRIDSARDHEGNAYAVVEIGTGADAQCWLKENMRATTEPEGTSILQNPHSGSSYSEPRAYYYDDLESNYQKYGCLYNFPADHQNGQSLQKEVRMNVLQQLPPLPIINPVSTHCLPVILMKKTLCLVDWANWDCRQLSAVSTKVLQWSFLSIRPASPLL